MWVLTRWEQDKRAAINRGRHRHATRYTVHGIGGSECLHYPGPGSHHLWTCEHVEKRRKTGGNPVEGVWTCRQVARERGNRMLHFGDCRFKDFSCAWIFRPDNCVCRWENENGENTQKTHLSSWQGRGCVWIKDGSASTSASLAPSSLLLWQ